MVTQRMLCLGEALCYLLCCVIRPVSACFAQLLYKPLQPALSLSTVLIPPPHILLLIDSHRVFNAVPAAAAFLHRKHETTFPPHNDTATRSFLFLNVYFLMFD